MTINPIIWKSVIGLIAAPGAGQLIIISSAAVTSAAINHFLKQRGLDVLAAILNRLIWIGAGIMFMDAFFDAAKVVQALFDLKNF